MKYFKMYKEDGAVEEITKEQAKHTLSGWWQEESLNDIFGNDKAFRLYTPFADVWTNDNGKVPAAGFYGVCGD